MGHKSYQIALGSSAVIKHGQKRPKDTSSGLDISPDTQKSQPPRKVRAGMGKRLVFCGKITQFTRIMYYSTHINLINHADKDKCTQSQPLHPIDQNTTLPIQSKINHYHNATSYYIINFNIYQQTAHSSNPMSDNTSSVHGTQSSMVQVKKSALYNNRY